MSLAASDCPEVPGYTFSKGKDVSGYDIKRVGLGDASAYSLYTECNNSPGVWVHGACWPHHALARAPFICHVSMALPCALRHFTRDNPHLIIAVHPRWFALGAPNRNPPADPMHAFTHGRHGVRARRVPILQHRRVHQVLEPQQRPLGELHQRLVRRGVHAQRRR